MRKDPQKYINPMNHRESVFAVFYLPIHTFVLPNLLMLLFRSGIINETQVNVMCYGVGLAMVLMYELGYMRRQFDPFLDRFGLCIGQIILSYGLMLGCNMVLNTALGFFADMSRNPNNESVMALAEYGSDGTVFAVAVFMAPIIEEIMFRGGLFGWLRQYRRFWAYVATVLIFSLYHVWPYLMLDWRNAVYILQYVPVGILLCRLYEKIGSIWSCIFFHMLNNYVALKALSLIEQFV